MRTTFFLFAVFALFSTVGFAQDFETQDYSEDLELEKIYLTALLPTNITFTRSLAVPYNTHSGSGSIVEEVTLSLTGYLKEIDPQSSELTMYAERAYELVNGTMEWNIQQTSDDGGTKCRLVQVIGGEGKDSPSNLDVPYDVNNGLVAKKGLGG